MTKTVHSVKLIPYDGINLDKLAYDRGELVYDLTAGTIRLMDGSSLGGVKFATQTYVDSKISTEVTGRNSAIAGAISTALTGYVTTTAQTTALASYVTTLAQTTALASYVTTASLATTLNSYATSTSLATAAVASAAKLTTARNINGVAFDGTASITVTADASTLSGTTLKSTVVTSNLSSVGTLNSLTVTGLITSSAVPTLPAHTTNKRYVDARALAMSVALS
jgi:hypothetical protein